jgi:hypothetical protein
MMSACGSDTYLDGGTTPAAATTVHYVSINQSRPYYKIRFGNLHSIRVVIADTEGEPDALETY